MGTDLFIPPYVWWEHTSLFLLMYDGHIPVYSSLFTMGTDQFTPPYLWWEQTSLFLLIYDGTYQFIPPYLWWEQTSLLLLIYVKALLQKRNMLPFCHIEYCRFFKLCVIKNPLELYFWPSISKWQHFFFSAKLSSLLVVCLIIFSLNEPLQKKINIVDSAKYIDRDQPKHTARLTLTDTECVGAD